MSSVLRPVRKRKKGRTLGPVNIIQREDYTDLELDTKVELIRSLIPLGLMHVQEVLDQEVTALAGERYARKDASVGGRRHGTNPGTVGLAGQRVPIRVPRMRSVAVSTSLRQPGSAFTVATPRHRRGATTTDRAAVAAGQRPHAASRPGCRSSVLGHPGGWFSTAD